MKRYFIITGTVTYAIKGRNALRHSGYSAEISRMTNANENVGCGYGVITNCTPETAMELFGRNGIKYLGVRDSD